MKSKIEDIALIVFQVAVFILGATFVVSIVAIVARFAWMLMFAKACIKGG
jgi:hypothetical protein